MPGLFTSSQSGNKNGSINAYGSAEGTNEFLPYLGLAVVESIDCLLLIHISRDTGTDTILIKALAN